MRIFLVDTENVASAWQPLLDTLKDKNLILLFYTEYTSVLNLCIVDKILQFPNQVKTIICKRCGKNSLDFQLVSYLGYLIQENPYAEYIMVSNDKGFCAVSDFWSKKGYNIKTWDIDTLNKKIQKNPHLFLHY